MQTDTERTQVNDPCCFINRGGKTDLNMYMWSRFIFSRQNFSIISKKIVYESKADVVMSGHVDPLILLLDTDPKCCSFLSSVVSKSTECGLPATHICLILWLHPNTCCIDINTKTVILTNNSVAWGKQNTSYLRHTTQDPHIT